MFNFIWIKMVIINIELILFLEISQIIIKIKKKVSISPKIKYPFSFFPFFFFFSIFYVDFFKERKERKGKEKELRRR